MKHARTVLVLGPLLAIACGQGAAPRSEEATTTSADLTTQSAAPGAAQDDPHKDWIHVAGGHLMHPSCVHQAPDGAHVDAHGYVAADGKRTDFPDCAYAPYDVPNAQKPLASDSASSVPGGTLNGWLLNDQAISSTYLTALSNSWTVPAAPTHSETGETLIMFGSFTTPEANNMILQPELRWTKANGWFTTAEVFVNGGARCAQWDFQTSYLKAAVGDTIGGHMAIISVTNGVQRWEVSVTDSTNHTSTGFTVDGVDCAVGKQVFKAAQGAVLEVHNVSQCNDLPADSVVFSHNLYESTSTTILANSMPTTRTFSPTWKQYYINNSTQPFGSSCPFGVNESSDGTGTTLSY